MTLRDYQVELVAKAVSIIDKYSLVYLALEMRVGKTLISLATCDAIGAKRVLFVTKKKAISSIQSDYNQSKFNFSLKITNYESLHKINDDDLDVVIIDEAHSLGSYPKPSKRAKDLKEICKNNQTKIIYLSGTPSPESYSQLYHQFWITPHSPFGDWDNFYKWVRAEFVIVTQIRAAGGMLVNNYSQAVKKKIDMYCSKLFISYTQKEANFEVTELDDEIIEVTEDNRLCKLQNILLNTNYYKFKNGDEIICDSAVKLQNKIHQLSSGTIIAERGVYKLDASKANYIKNNLYGGKIAIFYLFNAEGEVLKETFPNWTDDPQKFNNSDNRTVFISQFQSGSRGINLSSASTIIFYNIHFSSELYQQARQRGQEKNKLTKTRLIWLFSKNGIEKNIYRRVINKQSYTLTYFRKDYLQ